MALRRSAHGLGDKTILIESDDMGTTCWVPFLAATVFLLTGLPQSLEATPWNSWLSQQVTLLIGGSLLVLMVRAKSARSLLIPLGQGIGALSRLSEPVLVGSAVLLFFLLTGKLSGLLFSHLPHIQDTHAQYAQAKIFAAGHFSIPSHPFRAFFDAEFFINDGRFYTQYPPGHAFLLAIGHLVGRPWVINPLLGALTAGAIFYLGKEIGGKRVGLLSMALMFCSPFVVFMSSEYMNHATALLMTVLFSLFYIRVVKHADTLSAVGAGLAFGWLFLTRPQNAAVLALPFAVHAMWALRRPTLVNIRMYAVIALSAMPLFLFFLYYNQQTTGDPLVTGYQKYDMSQVPGGGLWLKEGQGGWSKHYERVVWQTQALHDQMFGWPVSSLVFVCLLFALRADKPFCLLLASVFVMTCISLVFIPFGFTDLFGPRYLYETSGSLIVLTALGISRVAPLWRKNLSVKVELATWRAGLAILIGLMTLMGLLTTTKDLYKTYSDRYGVGDPGIYNHIVENVETPALVFVKDEWIYGKLTFLLPPDDTAPLILARGLDERNVELMNYYPHHHTYEFIPRQGLRPLPRP